ncbi:hypothetical protein ACHAWF_001653 [Thalassiosira exigua]
MEAFVRRCEQARARGSTSPFSSLSTMPLAILASFATVATFLTLLAVVSSRWNSSGSSADAATKPRDLNLLTIYPPEVSNSIRSIEGRTDVLVTDANRGAVDAVRTAIEMEHELRARKRRRRKGGWIGALLALSNFIAGLGAEEDPEVPEGDVVLHAYGDVEMREYLIERGGRCSANGEGGGESAVLRRYDSLMSLRDDEATGGASSWRDAWRLFAWCQFANGDARGYVAHGTRVRPSPANEEDAGLRRVLEGARADGLGVFAGGGRPSPLFAMPDGGEAGDPIREMLRAELAGEESSLLAPQTTGPRETLMFDLSDQAPDRLTEGRGNSSWLFLDAVVAGEGKGAAPSER